MLIGLSVTAFGELEVHYLQDQLKTYSKPDVAWIASIQVWALLMFSMLCGRYFDSHGIRLLLVCGWTSMTVALIGVACEFSIFDQLWVLVDGDSLSRILPILPRPFALWNGLEHDLRTQFVHHRSVVRQETSDCNGNRFGRDGVWWYHISHHDLPTPQVDLWVPLKALSKRAADLSPQPSATPFSRSWV